MAVSEAEAHHSWEVWVRNEFGGSPQRVSAVMKIVSSAITQKLPSDAIAALARQASAVWDSAESAANDRNGYSPPTGFNGAAPPNPSRIPPDLPGEPGRGIYDLVAADTSELGRATLASLDAINLDTRLRTKAFLATRGFRGRYSFTGLSRSWVVSLTFFLVIATLIVGMMGEMVPPEINDGASWVLGFAMYALAAEILFFVIVTPFLARRAKVVVRHGRILLTYGLFTTTPIVIEVHWIREAMWSQSFAQKLLGEASFLIHYDTPGRGVMLLSIPGLVRVRDMQDYADKVRSASQKLRQGQGRYYSGGFVN